MIARPERRLQFKIALACGLPHPDFFLTKMTSSQYSELLAYLRIHPIGNEANRRAGQICANIANAARTSNTSRIFRAIDFFHIVDPPRPKQSWRHIKDTLLTAFKDRIRKRKKE